MAPDTPIPVSVLVALGLVGCTQSQACLSMIGPEDTSISDTGDTWGACLSLAETGETGGDTADTGCDSGDTGCGEPDTTEQLGRRGEGLPEGLVERLPDDVLRRLLAE
jgi:hypothetical protein